jgi:hypothetical protein
MTTAVAGMCAGPDSFEDIDVLRHVGIRTLFDGVHALSTVGTLLRGFTFGHARLLGFGLEHLSSRRGAEAPPPHSLATVLARWHHGTHRRRPTGRGD